MYTINEDQTINTLLYLKHKLDCESLTEMFSQREKNFKIDSTTNLNLAKIKVKVQEFEIIIIDHKIGNSELTEFINFCRNTNKKSEILLLYSDISSNIFETYKSLGVNAFLSTKKGFEVLKTGLYTLLKGEGFYL